MSIKTFAIGTVAGGITIFAAGTTIFSLPLLADFYTYAMTSGSASGVPRETPILWAGFLGALAYGALVTLAVDRTRAVKVAAGLKTGACVGLLLWLTADLMLYAVSNVGTLTSALTDPLVELIPGAIAGAVIAPVLRRVGQTRGEGLHNVPA
jgi:hypothetical protein